MAKRFQWQFYIISLAVLLLPSLLFSKKAVIDCSYRSDFYSCYLTTKDKYERNLATLERGLVVDVIARSANGRWKVRILNLNDGRVQPHGNWPNGGKPVGWVNPDFIDFFEDGYSGSLPRPAPRSATRPAPRSASRPAPSLSETSSNSAISLLGEFLPADQGAGSREDGPSGASSLDNGPPSSGAMELPESSGGLTGSEFLRRTSGFSASQREQAILRAIRDGHIPSFLRNFVEVSLRWRGPSGREHRARLRVAPDYMAVGSNEDFVRMPMAADTAQRVADLFDCSLPRPKLVDAIWAQATYQLRPRPLPPGSQMCSNDYFARANALIEEELGNRPYGPLTAGNKKDIVLSNRLLSNPGKVAIYGWHRSNGSPIQPLSTVHGASYADYSHGVRLVSNDLIVDGRRMRMREVLSDDELSGLLSNERPVRVFSYFD